MKELDLDELDKAVGKLMDKASKQKTVRTKPVAVKSIASPALTSTTSDDTVVPVRRATLNIPQRKKGIAMDIMQPKTVPSAPPSAKAARVAPTLQPTQSVTPEPPTPQPVESIKVESAPEPSPEAHELSDDTLAAIDMLEDSNVAKKPEAITESDAHKSDFPDPLEVHGFKDEDDKRLPEPDEPKPALETEKPTLEHKQVIKPVDEPAEAQATAATESEPTPEKPAEPTKDEPLPEAASPFVAAKVEKRPLGAYATAATTTEQPAKDEPSATEPKPESEKPTHEAATITTQTPKEFSPELVAVESAEQEFTPEAPEAANKAAESEKSADMDSLRQMEIPKQYHEQEKAPDEKDRPIFDTKDYHPALEPAKAGQRPSRAGAILTVILILLMIAAATIAYFMITGTIDLDVMRWF